MLTIILLLYKQLTLHASGLKNVAGLGKVSLNVMAIRQEQSGVTSAPRPILIALVIRVNWYYYVHVDSDFLLIIHALQICVCRAHRTHLPLLPFWPRELVKSLMFWGKLKVSGLC